jgi:hypothetical protein
LDFYLHECFWNFSQLLAICFELFLSKSIFNSKNRCRGVPPVSLSLRAGPPVSTLFLRGCHPPALAPHTRHKGAGRQRRGPSRSAPTARPPPHLARRRQPCPKPPPLCFRPRVSERATLPSPSPPPRRRVFTSSRPRSPLFRRRFRHLTSPPSSRVGHHRVARARAPSTPRHLRCPRLAVYPVRRRR